MTSIMWPYRQSSTFVLKQFEILCLFGAVLLWSRFRNSYLNFLSYFWQNNLTMQLSNESSLPRYLTKTVWLVLKNRLKPCWTHEDYYPINDVHTDENCQYVNGRWLYTLQKNVNFELKKNPDAFMSLLVDNDDFNLSKLNRVTVVGTRLL